MKIRKTLTVAGKAFDIISDDIRLELCGTGRAVFQIKAKESVTGLVQFFVGYSTQDKDRLYFTGYIDSCHMVDNGQQRIFCRELSGVLDLHCPISMRHPTLVDVLNHYTEKTGIIFIVPDKPYSSTRVPFFQTLGDGYHGVDSFGSVFSIPDYVWQPQPDGRVFVGSWTDTKNVNEPLELAEKWFKRVFTDGSKCCPIIPAMRPGIKLNGKRVKQVQLKGHEMVITCVK
ncbi:hypothetical protein [Maridesulfovibrio ferrireducens]|uniref:hypothetical protein n=1 Tax=Maridesulfovibrio ferrireducens TaxID=246191 RepID=UPI001A34E794|nr:hypothetical protein [Maridesulfovibrio ferrireducens]MBI9109919.1 hypothetical protein [Maridesulfovibrio ferrireducens]